MFQYLSLIFYFENHPILYGFNPNNHKLKAEWFGSTILYNQTLPKWLSTRDYRQALCAKAIEQSYGGLWPEEDLYPHRSSQRRHNEPCIAIRSRLCHLAHVQSAVQRESYGVRLYCLKHRLRLGQKVACLARGPDAMLGVRSDCLKHRLRLGQKIRPMP